MDRLVFTKSMGLPLSIALVQRFPEITAMYNLIDADKYKVEGHLLENNKISFTVYCNQEEAIKISNMVYSHNMELYDTKICMSYSIHKNGIDLVVN